MPCQTRGLSAAWGRIFFLYGPREHPARLVASCYRLFFEGRTGSLFSWRPDPGFSPRSRRRRRVCRASGGGCHGTGEYRAHAPSPKEIVHEIAGSDRASGAGSLKRPTRGAERVASGVADVRRLSEEVVDSRYDLDDGQGQWDTLVERSDLRAASLEARHVFRGFNQTKLSCAASGCPFISTCDAGRHPL